METLSFVIIAVALVIAFDMLAGRFGADSRDSIGDDHRRIAGS
jgi:hypothetical protein